jgi:hypothetical protein
MSEAKMPVDQIFARMDGMVLALVAELRLANRERNALRRGMQIIVDLKAGGVAEEIARQMLEEFVEIRRENDEIAMPSLGRPVLYVECLRDVP